jgi:hypothetical protein
MERDKLFGNGPLSSSQRCPSIAGAERKSLHHVWTLDHAIGNAEEFPYRMAAEVVVLLTIRKCCRKRATLGRSQAPVVEERLLAKRSCFPTQHPGSRNRDPVNASGPVGEISAYIRETLTPKQLALACNVELAFETIGFRVVATFFAEDRSGDAQSRILSELIQEKLKVIRVQRNVGVQIANDLVFEVFDSFPTGIEGMYLCREIPLAARRQIYQFDPVILRSVGLDPTRGAVG